MNGPKSTSSLFLEAGSDESGQPSLFESTYSVTKSQSVVTVAANHKEHAEMFIEEISPDGVYTLRLAHFLPRDLEGKYNEAHASSVYWKPSVDDLHNFSGKKRWGFVAHEILERGKVLGWLKKGHIPKRSSYKLVRESSDKLDSNTLVKNILSQRDGPEKPFNVRGIYAVGVKEEYKGHNCITWIIAQCDKLGLDVRASCSSSCDAAASMPSIHAGKKGCCIL